MQQRTRNINQVIIDSKITFFDNTKMYFFLTAAGDGTNYCVSAISENKLELLAAD